ncbi:MAG: tRNA (adenosine(37)-N6)-threonylcarbamoyltransferase complex dimerization subunit type 1 TsaB [Planctomycetales bacterium]|nr:tRNA (adenosine(37)-N6)-threonylcarbamoyltransferase complex dimerization subunit type 1 TsaB [Planctomycetales bacterium]
MIVESQNMLTLALDTSGPIGSVALREAGLLLDEQSLQLGVHHGQSLVSEVQQLFRNCERQIWDCNLVAVSIGPGSFTGLRVGVVFAKTLAYATGCRVAAINTLLAIAHNAPSDVDRVQVVSDAQRSELFVEIFDRQPDGRWRSSSPVEIVNGEKWTAGLEKEAVVMGPGLEKFAKVLAGRCRILEPASWTPQAARLAELGEQATRDHALADPWALEPSYLRKSSAEEKWEARQRAVVDSRGSRVPQAADRL